MHGLLLVHADLDGVRTWARRGLVAVRIEAVHPWTAVTPADAWARSSPPYADGVAALAARPLGPSLRPSLGFFVTGEIGVLTARDSGWRALQRWLLWTAEAGPTHSEDLPPLDVDALVETAGFRGRIDAIHEALGGPAADPLVWLGRVHAALRLPGRELLLHGASSRSELVEPDEKSVRRFDALAADELAHHRDLAGER